jgi:hypothetical protein
VTQGYPSDVYFAIANHVYSLKLGRVAFSGHPADLTTTSEKLRMLFL